MSDSERREDEEQLGDDEMEEEEEEEEDRGVNEVDNGRVETSEWVLRWYGIFVSVTVIEGMNNIYKN